jgi:propionyl-CoA carboxylase beta chain
MADATRTTRERLGALFDPGSFVELDRPVPRHGRAPSRDSPCDGAVTGHGTIDGRRACAFAEDVVTPGEGQVPDHGARRTRKILKVVDLAMTIGCPLIGLFGTGGCAEGEGRIRQGLAGLGRHGEILRRAVHASGVIPQISLVAGPCEGWTAMLPAVTDFTVMVDRTSHLIVTGCDAIRTVTGDDLSLEDLAGARTHNTRSGNAHYLGADEDDALEYVRQLLSFLPANNLTDPPVLDAAQDEDSDDPDLDCLISEAGGQPYDMDAVIESVVDLGEFLEVQPLFARNLIIGFGRVGGRPVGVVANRPTHLSGFLDIGASEKAARFVRTCDCFNIPLLTIVDAPGFLPGVDQELGGLIRRGAKLAYAYAEATVPKVTVVTRKAHGAAYAVMGSAHLGADVTVAWTTASLAAAGAQEAVGLTRREELDAVAEAGGDVDAARFTLVTDYDNTIATWHDAAEHCYVDAVIPPSATRREVATALRMLTTKRASLPPKRHGNIPL